MLRRGPESNVVVLGLQVPLSVLLRTERDFVPDVDRIISY